MASKIRTQIPRPPSRKRKASVRPVPPRPKGELERLAVRRLAAMRYRRATYSVIAEKLTGDRAREYADAHDISVERAMKKIPHVSTRTAWDDVLAEFEGLRRETEITRGDAMAMENTRIDQLYAKALGSVLEGECSGRPAGTLSVMGRRAKLNGLDAPTKIAPTDPTGEFQADTGAINVNTLSEDTLRRVLRDEKREPLDVTRCR